MQLLERERCLEELAERAHHAVAGRGGVVLVAGEAGIGKTVLLRAFVERVRPSAPALWGMCDPLSTPRPLGPVHDVADELDASLPALLRGPAAPHEIFAAVLHALRARPRVFVVEDLHWGDEATLDLVRFLARRVASLPLLLVVSYRDALDADHPLSAVLGDLVRTPEARRLQPAPLSREAVATLLDGLPDRRPGRPGPDPADVHRRTAGNPFFVSQILAQPESPLPANVRDAVLARIAGLAPPARRSLELLSCTPEPVGRALLDALGVSPTTVGVLAATGLVDRHGRGVAFRHEIARSAVLDAVAPGSEPALHAAMIDALEAVGGDPSALAHHAAAAGDVPRVLRYAPAAAAEASRSGAHREAVAFYETALRHAGDDPVADTAARAALLETMSLDLYLADRLRDAIAARERALELRRGTGQVVAVGAAHTALAGFAWGAADRALAERHAAAAVEILSSAGDPRALGFALSRYSFLAAWRGDAAEARRAGQRAARIADELGDAVLRGTASIGVAVARLLDGDLRGRADLLAASATGLAHQLDDLATTPLANLCHYDVEHGRLGDAEESVADALRISAQRDAPICTAYLLGVRARMRLLQGRWAEAADDARAVLRSGDIPLGRLWPHLVLGLLVARREAPPENPDLDELWERVHTLDNPVLVAAAATALAENAWITRRPDPRLDEPLAADLFTRPFAGQDAALAPLRRWARRLAEAGLPHGPAPPTAPPDTSAGGVGGDQPYERALALWDAGSPDDLLAALPLLDGLDARAVCALFRARLREAGVHGVPRGRLAATRANPAGLTARQLDVLALLARGLSNADIAARLVISPKTADHHVSAILAKLDVRSRVEAAAVARRLGV